MMKGTVATNECGGGSKDPWVGKIPWRRKWQPPPGFLPGKSHGQRSLAGYSPVHGVAKRHDCAHTHEVRWFSFTLKFDIHCFSIADGEDKVT